MVKAARIYTKELNRGVIVEEAAKELNLRYTDTVYQLVTFSCIGTGKKLRKDSNFTSLK